MRSRLCIPETVKLLKMIFDSAMASKMKNIYHNKTSLFYPEDVFHPKKNFMVSQRNQTLSNLIFFFFFGGKFSLVFFTTSQLHILTNSNVCRKLLHCGCLLCVHKLMKFTYDVIFYVAFVTHICVSLFTGIHCDICIVKKL